MVDGWRVPDDVDSRRPSAARVYDYYLGGSHNFEADREMARRAIELWPELPLIMQANRAFLRRAVQYLLRQGITQFLDLGSGIPTVGNVHEIAHTVRPDARVVYVDIDPVAVAQSRAILAGDERCDVVEADLCDVPAVLSDPRTTRLLDLSRPVGLLTVAVLHFVPDTADPAGVLGRYGEALAPGSFLAVSHATHEGEPDQAGPHTSLYRRTGTPMTMRSRDEITAMLEGFDLVEPGVVYLPLWRPDPRDAVVEHPERVTGLAAVGRRRQWPHRASGRTPPRPGPPSPGPGPRRSPARATWPWLPPSWPATSPGSPTAWPTSWPPPTTHRRPRPGSAPSWWRRTSPGPTR